MMLAMMMMRMLAWAICWCDDDDDIGDDYDDDDNDDDDGDDGGDVVDDDADDVGMGHRLRPERVSCALEIHSQEHSALPAGCILHTEQCTYTGTSPVQIPVHCSYIVHQCVFKNLQGASKKCPIAIFA